jgi:Ca2+:H+ antiporter
MCVLAYKQSYLIGLWFSLRTHAAQIWQNPQQLMKAEDHPAAMPGLHPSLRNTLIQRSTPQSVLHNILPVHKDRANPVTGPGSPSTPTASTSQAGYFRDQMSSVPKSDPAQEDSSSKVSGGTFNLPPGYTPFLESIDTSMKTQQHLTPMRLPETLTTEDFTRAVAVATVSALRHQGSITQSHHGSVRKDKAPVQPVAPKDEEDESEGGGHEAPSWTRGTSAGVLLACTLLYAIIAGACSLAGFRL